MSSLQYLFRLSLVALVVVSGCAQGTKDLKRDRSRPVLEVPDAGVGVDDTAGGPPVSQCIPLTCAQAVAQCGPLDDQCGGSVYCGDCFDGALCGADGVPNQCAFVGEAPRVPQIIAVDYPVAAHYSRLVFTGSALSGVEAVFIGDVLHEFQAADDRIVVDFVLPNVPRGRDVPVRFEWADGSLEYLLDAVIHLVISEVDSDTRSADNATGTDQKEFVEIDIAIEESVSLAGYALVGVNGANETLYAIGDATVSLGTTTPDGWFVVGNQAVQPTPQMIIPSNTVQNGADALLLVQAPTGVPVGTNVADLPLRPLDAVVYGTNDAADPELLDQLTLTGALEEQVNESGGLSSEQDSIFRCNYQPFDGANFQVGVPTPGAYNACQ